MSYYAYRQNNSGGTYVGPETVIVRADSTGEANAIAREAGVDPDAPYCTCCGPRWSLYDDEYYAPIKGYQVAESVDEFNEWHDLSTAIIVEA